MGVWPRSFCFGNMFSRLGNVGRILSPTCLSHPFFLHKQINPEVILTIWKTALWLSHLPGRKAWWPGPFLSRFSTQRMHLPRVCSTAPSSHPLHSYVIYCRVEAFVPLGYSVFPRGYTGTLWVESMYISPLLTADWSVVFFYLARPLRVVKLQMEKSSISSWTKGKSPPFARDEFLLTESEELWLLV